MDIYDQSKMQARAVEPDFTRVPSCPTCGSIDVSIDVGTNKIVCHECGGEPVEPKPRDFETEQKDAITKELVEIQRRRELGEQFDIPKT